MGDPSLGVEQRHLGAEHVDPLAVGTDDGHLVKRQPAAGGEDLDTAIVRIGQPFRSQDLRARMAEHLLAP